MPETTRTPAQNRTEAFRLIELARALLTGSKTEIAGLFLDQALEALNCAGIKGNAPREKSETSIGIPRDEQ